MKKIYEASGEDKRTIIELNNDLEAHDRFIANKDNIGIDDMIMIARVSEIPFDGETDTVWSINGLKMPYREDGKEIIVVEPLKEQINNGVQNISPSETRFKNRLQLSDKAIILIPIALYEMMSDEDKKKIDDLDEKMHNIRFFEGDEDLAVRMLLSDKGFIYLDVGENGYFIREHSDAQEYAKILERKQKVISETLLEERTIIGYRRGQKKRYTRKLPNRDENFRMISGFTEKVEGDVRLDNTLSGATDIGKIRKNQEDAILLIRDKENPKFKMAVVADGMGGWINGEAASSMAVMELKDWFENLSQEQRQCYFTGIGGLKEVLLQEIGIKLQQRIAEETSRRNNFGLCSNGRTGDNGGKCGRFSCL